MVNLAAPVKSLGRSNRSDGADERKTKHGVNRNVEGRNVRRVLGYNGNGVHYRRKCEEIAAGGFREFAFR